MPRTVQGGRCKVEWTQCESQSVVSFGMTELRSYGVRSQYEGRSKSTNTRVLVLATVHCMNMSRYKRSTMNVNNTNYIVYTCSAFPFALSPATMARGYLPRNRAQSRRCGCMTFPRWPPLCRWCPSRWGSRGRSYRRDPPVKFNSLIGLIGLIDYMAMVEKCIVHFHTSG